VLHVNKNENHDVLPENKKENHDDPKNFFAACEQK